MNFTVFIYAFLLFFVLTPGVLLSLPPKGSKMVVAGVHALVFAVVWTLTHKMVWRATSMMFEGLQPFGYATLKDAYNTDHSSYYGDIPSIHPVNVMSKTN